MTDELKKAIKKAEKLPADQQRAIAEFILEEIKWEESFRNSADKLSILANEALSEYKAGKTKPGGW